MKCDTVRGSYRTNYRTNCKHCATSFLANWPNQVFCSDNCRDTSRRSRWMTIGVPAAPVEAAAKAAGMEPVEWAKAAVAKAVSEAHQ